MCRQVYIWLLQAGLALCLLYAPAASAQSTKHIDSLQHRLAAAKEDTARIQLMLALASAYKPDVVTKQFYYANEALNLSDKLNWDKGRMIAEEFIGDSYNNIQAYDDALVHYKTCLALARQLHHKGMEAYCLQLLFHVYNKLHDLPNALSDQKELVDLTDKEGNPVKICNQRSAYAMCLSDNDRHREAINYLLQDIAIAQAKLEGEEEINMVADILNTLSLIYIRTKQTDSALHCLWRARDYTKQTANYFLETYINSSFCDVYTNLNRPDSAIIYARRTVEMAAEIKDIDLQQKYCKALGQLYEKDGKPALALDYYKRSDSLFNVITSAQRMVDKAMQVTRINFEQQAVHNKMEKRSLELVRRNQQTMLVAAITVLLALIALTIFIYRNLRQKQAANKTISLQAASLQQQNETIDKALKEKEMLLKETHHRVKNNLQLISSLLELQAANITDEAAKNALRTAQDRVLSIATVHSKLYGSSEDEAIEFSAFVSDLFSRLDSAFGHIPVQFSNDIKTIHLPLGTVVLLGIMLNEFITNSFKHAFHGLEGPAIRINLETAGDVHILHYHDNGPGLRGNVFEEHTGSLGLYLVKRLGKQLKGSVAYKFESGSTFTIIFPHAAN